ncbi:hypothetical protein AG4045_025687 [Apium graveolens]|uniref:Uncharacterized protein n=1 Tax=Apium graveolens TaxID=4045 RepID=A0A6L5B977_APIGR|nr:hypothetical protein AG4045_025687 [Apium graveolens]
MKSAKNVSGLVLDENAFVGINKNQNFTELVKLAREAIGLGKKYWGEIVSGEVKIELGEKIMGNDSVECPKFLSLSEFEVRKNGGMVNGELR